MHALKRTKKRTLRTSLAVVAVATVTAALPLTPAAAKDTAIYTGPLTTDGGTASYRAGFRVIGPLSEGAFVMAVRDARADGYCVHGSVTYNVSWAPDPTYDSPEVCGYGTVRTWSHQHARYSPNQVKGMLLKVCKTIPSAPDPCSTKYYDNVLN